MKSLSKVSQVNKYATRVFLLSFEVALLLRMVILYSLIDSKFDTALFSVIAVLGGFVFVCNAIEWLQRREAPNILLMIIILAMVVSTLLTPEASLIGNAKMVIWQVIYFFIIYYIGKHQDPALFRWFENIVMVYWTVAVIFSLCLFFVKYSYTAPLSKIYYGLRLGIVENRLYGIFVEPNFASNLSVIVCVLMIKRMLSQRPHLHNAWYIVGLILQFVYIVLSGSRSALLDGCAIAFVAIFIICYGSEQASSWLKRWGKSILSGVIAVVVIVGANYAVKLTLPHLVVPTRIAFLENLSKGQADKQESGDVSLEREDITSNGDSSNGRLSLWKSALEITKTSPVWGGSPNDFIKYGQRKLPKSYISIHGQTPHNFVLLTLVGSGLLGAIPLVIFMIMKAIALIRALFKTRGMRDIDFILMAIIPIDMVLFASLMPDLIYENRIGALCFWLFLGLVTLGKQPGEERNDFHIGNYSAR